LNIELLAFMKSLEQKDLARVTDKQTKKFRFVSTIKLSRSGKMCQRVLTIFVMFYQQLFIFTFFDLFA